MDHMHAMDSIASRPSPSTHQASSSCWGMMTCMKPMQSMDASSRLAASVAGKDA